MAILFSAKKKKEMYLILICLFLFLVLGIFWMRFLFFGGEAGEEIVVPSDILEQQEKDVEIGLEKLEGEILKEMRPFESITPTQQKMGRQNPFAPVSSISPIEE